MAVINGPIVLTGAVGIKPMIKYMLSTDSLATITTAGYLNEQLTTLDGLSQSDVILIRYDYVQETGAGTNGFFNVAISGGIVTLSEDTTTDSVTYTPPSIANHLAVYSNTTGNLTKDTASAINAGNIQAGISGTAGAFVSYPTTASKGSFAFQAGDNAGNYALYLNNASHGQATIYSIPDCGASTANLILSKTTGTQHITVGSLGVDAGTIASGLAAGGQVGSFIAYPTTASKGSLRLTASVNATGDYSTTITNNLAQGQDIVVTIPDAGAPTGTFVLSQSALPTNHVTFTKHFTLTALELGAATKINIVVPETVTAQFIITDIKVMNSTGLSGGGGDRLLSVSDGTVVFNDTGITAALLGTPIFTLWGGAGNPIATGTQQYSTAGADIYFQYTGGTTDYTAGQVEIVVTLVQTIL